MGGHVGQARHLLFGMMARFSHMVHVDVFMGQLECGPTESIRGLENQVNPSHMAFIPRA